LSEESQILKVYPNTIWELDRKGILKEFDLAKEKIGIIE